MKRLYRGGEVSPLLHAIDALSWQAMGWSESPVPPPAAATQKPPDSPQGIPPALALINGTDVARDVAIIPTVGQGAAKVLIENRPDGGYASLEDAWGANPSLLEGRFKVDPQAVAEWGG